MRAWVLSGVVFVAAACGEARRERCELLQSGLAARAVECTVDISKVAVECGKEAKMGPSPECLQDIHKFTCHQLFGEKATWRGSNVVAIETIELPPTCAKR